MNGRLDQVLDLVCDEKTFADFIKALAADKEDEDAKEKLNRSPVWAAGANGWQNGTIDSFLEAAAAWAEATRKRIDPIHDEAGIWKRCAEIIYMGKLYE